MQEIKEEFQSSPENSPLRNESHVKDNHKRRRTSPDRQRKPYVICSEQCVQSPIMYHNSDSKYMPKSTTDSYRSGRESIATDAIGPVAGLPTNVQYMTLPPNCVPRSTTYVIPSAALFPASHDDTIGKLVERVESLERGVLSEMVDIKAVLGRLSSRIENLVKRSEERMVQQQEDNAKPGSYLSPVLSVCKLSRNDDARCSQRTSTSHLQMYKPITPTISPKKLNRPTSRQADFFDLTVDRDDAKNAVRNRSITQPRVQQKDSQQKDTQQNDTQQKDTQQNDTQQKDSQQKDTRVVQQHVPQRVSWNLRSPDRTEEETADWVPERIVTIRSSGNRRPQKLVEIYIECPSGRSYLRKTEIAKRLGIAVEEFVEISFASQDTRSGILMVLILQVNAAEIIQQLKRRGYVTGYVNADYLIEDRISRRERVSKIQRNTTSELARRWATEQLGGI